MGHEFVSFKELNLSGDFEELGESFEEIALAKARHFSNLSGLPTIADDSGIIVNALAGELGLKTRRWGAGEIATDDEWLTYFMKRMATESNRDAKFVCAAAFVNGDASFCHLEETIGEISESVEVDIKHGLPLSSVFRPIGFSKVYSALTDDEKNNISHRGKAFKKLLKTLQNA